MPGRGIDDALTARISVKSGAAICLRGLVEQSEKSVNGVKSTNNTSSLRTERMRSNYRDVALDLKLWMLETHYAEAYHVCLPIRTETGQLAHRAAFVLRTDNFFG